jgi:phage regulator Rha-like protein
MNTLPVTIPQETLINRIFLIRGKKVMFDRDLAELYGVETKVLNQAVKRNIERFPADFMFQLNYQETKVWQGYLSRSQFVTLKKGKNIKYSPTVFTEQGVAMLSSVLKSERAVQVNIQIIRTFTKLREILSDNKKLAEKLEGLEQKYDKKIADIFTVIKHLVVEEMKPKEKMGFNVK